MARVTLACTVLAGLLLASNAPARPPSPCASSPTPGERTVALTVGGARRSALLHIPPGLPAGRSLPLVLALHGVGGNGSKMEHYSGLSSVADREGFFVAYPSSQGSAWNTSGSPKRPRDVRFLSGLITYLRQSLCVDPERVYATGVSDGGFMVSLAACRLSAQIAAIAPVAGGYAAPRPCRPARPVSVLEIHGTADQVVPYYGHGRDRKTNSVMAYIRSWARRDGCFARPAVRPLAARTTSYSWGGCASAVSVQHIKIRGGRHQWPGATPPDPGPPATICAACTVWSFFAGLQTGPRTWPTDGGAGL